MIRFQVFPRIRACFVFFQGSKMPDARLAPIGESKSCFRLGIDQEAPSGSFSTCDV